MFRGLLQKVRIAEPRGIEDLLSDPSLSSRIESEWTALSCDFAAADAAIPTRFMERRELSFHEYIKLLGFLCAGLDGMGGDIVEIGVWKGKSLALMRRLASPPTRVIGVDPCEIAGQPDELAYFQRAVFPQCDLVIGYSQTSIEKVLAISNRFKLLHIDGSHFAENVWMDFLIYERFVIPGGYIVFDDYIDVVHSPQVAVAIDSMRDKGLFAGYEIIGSVPSYENSYVLRKL